MDTGLHTSRPSAHIVCGDVAVRPQADAHERRIPGRLWVTPLTARTSLSRKSASSAVGTSNGAWLVAASEMCNAAPRSGATPRGRQTWMQEPGLGSK